MSKLKKRFAFVGFIVMMAVSIVGCGMMQTKREEGTPVDFTVVKRADYPIEIEKLLEKKKQEKFQLFFRSGEDLYLMRGYGVQSTGGYSIQVEYVTETTEEIHIKTKLVGPDSSSTETEAISCPVIVVKMEAREKKIIFD